MAAKSGDYIFCLNSEVRYMYSSSKMGNHIGSLASHLGFLLWGVVNVRRFGLDKYAYICTPTITYTIQRLYTHHILYPFETIPYSPQDVYWGRGAFSSGLE